MELVLIGLGGELVGWSPRALCRPEGNGMRDELLAFALGRRRGGELSARA